MTARVLLLAALLLVGGCAVAHVSPDYAKAKLTAHHLVMDVDTTCSATAVGPNVLLAAAHCFEGASELMVSGTSVEWKIIANDGNDHVLVRVDITFKHFAKRGPKPSQGDVVFMHGNPLSYRDILRVGYYAGTIEGIGVFDMEATRGDSGSAIFDRNGAVIGMLSAIQVVDIYTMAMSFEMRFTDEQWKLAQ